MKNIAHIAQRHSFICVSVNVRKLRCLCCAPSHFYCFLRNAYLFPVWHFAQCADKIRPSGGFSPLHCFVLYFCVDQIRFSLLNLCRAFSSLNTCDNTRVLHTLNYTVNCCQTLLWAVISECCHIVSFPLYQMYSEELCHVLWTVMG